MTNKENIRPVGVVPIPHKKTERILSFNEPATNALAGEKTFVKFKNVPGSAEYEIGRGGSCAINSISHDKFRKNFPIRYLDILSGEIAERNNRGCENVERSIRVRVKRIQDLFGFKNYNATVRALKQWNEVLYSYSITYSIPLYYKKKKAFLKADTRILSTKTEIKWGVCYVVFTEEFIKYIVCGHLINWPLAYFKLKSSVDAEVYRKLFLNARINERKKKEDGNKIIFIKNKEKHNLLSVKSILKSVQSIPSHNDVIGEKGGDGHVGRRIIKRFERSLTELQRAGLLEWEYYDKNGIVAIDEGVCGQKLKWDVFKDLHIKYSLSRHEMEVAWEIAQGKGKKGETD